MASIHTQFKDFEKTIKLFKVEYEVPDPPNLNTIIGYNRPQSEQRWRREELPKFWNNKYLQIVAHERYKGNEDWWRKNSTREMRDYAEEEWDRRMNGYWLFINGKPTYLTGINYFYCQWFRIDSGYPQYRDRDRRFWYMWDHIENDQSCYGMIYPKHRREGASYRGGCMLVEYISRTHNANGGIQSKRDADAAKFFKEKVVAPFFKLPAFFKPLQDGNDRPKKEILFQAPARRLGSGKSAIIDREEEDLESMINYEPTVFNAYDSTKQHRMVVDESTKFKPQCSLEDMLPVIMECLTDGPRKYKLYLPSTIDAKSSEMGMENFKKVWYDSDPEDLDPILGRTKSGLKQYFTPSYDGLREDFFDEFGGSVIDDPTPSQLKRLIRLHPQSAEIKLGMGAKRYKETERKLKEEVGPKALSEEKRLYPFTPEEAFYKPSSQMFWDQNKINNLRNTLQGRKANGVGDVQSDYVQYGNLEFIEDDWGWKSEQWKGTVRFVPCHKDQARFHFRWDLGFAEREKGGIHFNAVRTHKGLLHPNQADVFVIGNDPIGFDKDHVKSSKLSDAGAHGFRRYQHRVDANKDPEDWLTHSFVFEYLSRPEINETYFQDMLMACIFFGCKIHIERQWIVPIYDYFKRMRATPFIMFRPENVMPGERKNQKVAPGTPGNEIIYNEGFRLIKRFINNACFINRIPFERTLGQLLEFDYAKKTKFDLVISMVFTIVVAGRDDEDEEEKEEIIHRGLMSMAPFYKRAQ